MIKILVCFLLELRAAKIINRTSTTDYLIYLQTLTNAVLPSTSVIQMPMGNLARVRFFFEGRLGGYLVNAQVRVLFM